MAQASSESLLHAVREAIACDSAAEACEALAAMAPCYSEVAPTDAVDLLERACAYGSLPVVEAIYQAFPEIVYEGWALALALRCAHEDVARLLLSRGVDLLGDVRPPTTYRALLPHEGTFTRFDLTRKSPTLFLNPMDPTVSSEVFEPFRGRANESLAQPAYELPTNLDATCALVAHLASEGLFDAVVFDDLLRAALVRAWHALRHEGQRDEAAAETCLAFASQMLAMGFMRSQGDEVIRSILGSLIVPKVHPRIVQFVCDEAPEVFLARLHELSWLQRDVDLVARMVTHLQSGPPEHNATLLKVLAASGRMRELELIKDWDNTFTCANVEMAMDVAARAGQGEAAAWLLARRPSTPTGSADDLLDLLL